MDPHMGPHYMAQPTQGLHTQNDCMALRAKSLRSWHGGLARRGVFQCWSTSTDARRTSVCMRVPRSFACRCVLTTTLYTRVRAAHCSWTMRIQAAARVARVCRPHKMSARARKRGLAGHGGWLLPVLFYMLSAPGPVPGPAVCEAAGGLSLKCTSLSQSNDFFVVGVDGTVGECNAVAAALNTIIKVCDSSIGSDEFTCNSLGSTVYFQGNTGGAGADLQVRQPQN